VRRGESAGPGADATCCTVADVQDAAGKAAEKAAPAADDFLSGILSAGESRD